MFKVGDRVKCIVNYSGVKYGELGVIQEVRQFLDGCDLDVRWDTYDHRRHDNCGLCERGHGWMVSPCDVELVCEVVDLGELSDASPDISSLFI